MLILTRRIGEQFRIGDDITIMVLEVQGTQVRLGITAPREVEVHREEIYQRIRQERRKRGELSCVMQEENEDNLGNR